MSSGRRILLVDDDDIVLRVLARVLGKHFVAECASSAAEGRQLLAKQEFDCIICDFLMPGESGLEFLGWVRKTHPNVIRVLVSAVISTDVGEDLIADGDIHAFFQKPADMTVFVERTRELLTQRDGAA